MIINTVYIKFVWRLVLLAIVVYCMVFVHFKGDSTIILPSKVTISDMLYYTAIQFSIFLGSLAFNFLCLFVESNYRTLSTVYLKYLSYGITVLLFWRLCFHFRYYDEIVLLEVIFDIVTLLGIAIRMFYITSNLK